MIYISLGIIILSFLMSVSSVLKSDNFKQKFAEKKAQKTKNKKLKNRNKDAMALKEPTREFIRNTIVEVGASYDYKYAVQAINFNIFTEDIERYDSTRHLISRGLDEEKAELFKTFFNSDNFSKTELEEISYLILLKIHTFFPSFVNCLIIYEDKESPYNLRKKAIKSMWEILSEVAIDTMIPLLEAKKENREIEQTAYQRQLKSLKDSVELDKEIYSRYKGN